MPINAEEFERTAGFERAVATKTADNGDQRYKSALGSIPGVHQTSVAQPSRASEDNKHPVGFLRQLIYERGDQEKNLTIYTRLMHPSKESASLCQLELAKLGIRVDLIEMKGDLRPVWLHYFPEESSPAVLRVIYRATSDNLYDCFTSVDRASSQFAAKLIDLQYVGD